MSLMVKEYRLVGGVVELYAYHDATDGRWEAFQVLTARGIVVPVADLSLEGVTAIL